MRRAAGSRHICADGQELSGTPGFESRVLVRTDLNAMNNARAIRYRRLALSEDDRATADLLLKLADEYDRGLLCTAEWLSARPYKIERHLKPAEFKAWAAD
jgi:hypothetical protein